MSEYIVTSVYYMDYTTEINLKCPIHIQLNRAILLCEVIFDRQTEQTAQF
jgi:hypothetical protein